MIVISESLQCLVEVFKNLQFPLHLAKSHGHLCLYCNFVAGSRLIEFEFDHDEVYQVPSKQCVSIADS